MTERVIHEGQEEEPEELEFVPDPGRAADCEMAKHTAFSRIDRGGGQTAIAAAVLTLALQVGRIADAVEFAMVNNY